MKTFSKRPSDQEEQERVACAVCGRRDARPHWRCDGFAFVQCPGCGHIYQSPRPTGAALAARYDSEYADYEVENSENFLDLMLKGLDDLRVFERIDRAHGPTSVLDVGCATGALLEYLAERGFRVQGVEPCAPAAEYGRTRRGVAIQTGTLEALASTERYSVIHSSHVIEHVPDPRAFLREIHGRLEPNGFAVIVTPNTASLQACMFAASWRSAIADHVNLFSLRNLTELARAEGLERVAWKSWGGLGVGTAPAWVKRPVDRMAKALGFGDVMAILFAPYTAV